MRLFFQSGLARQPAPHTDTTIAQVRDYTERSQKMGAQRLIIFVAAFVLQSFSVGAVYALIALILIVLAEVYDRRTFAQASQMAANDAGMLRHVLRRIHIGTIYGAGVVCFFSLSVAFAPGDSTYFMAMCFLIAASLFTAMNSHQLISVLIIRLAAYSATFLTIPLLGLILSQPNAVGQNLLHLCTSLFVLYFVIDSSVVGLRYYRINKRQLDQLRLENRRANAALAAKTEFLSTVSHELRTPLTSVRGALDMAVAGAFGPMPDKSQLALGIAKRNATRLSKLIDELLDLQKMEVGKMQFDFCTVQLASLVADAIADNQSYAQELDITLKMLPVDTDLYVRADPMRLEQVITNLLSNAAKFSPAGNEVTLSVSSSEHGVRICVSDKGTGIDPADRARIFDSFSQLDNSDIRKINGTGLGLNISKRIVLAHGGSIDFMANGEQGTTFFVDLARLSVERGATAADEPAPILRTGP